MSIFSNKIEQDLINLGKLAEQQKSHRAFKYKNRILKRSHGKELAEILSPIPKIINNINETTENLGEIVQKSDVGDGNTQTPAIENITLTQSLRDTIALMKRIKWRCILE